MLEIADVNKSSYQAFVGVLISAVATIGLTFALRVLERRFDASRA